MLKYIQTPKIKGNLKLQTDLFKPWFPKSGEAKKLQGAKQNDDFRNPRISEAEFQ